MTAQKNVSKPLAPDQDEPAAVQGPRRPALIQPEAAEAAAQPAGGEGRAASADRKDAGTGEAGQAARAQPAEATPEGDAALPAGGAGPGKGAAKGPGKGPGKGKGGRPKPRRNAPQPPVRPTAGKARLRRRHVALMLSFLLVVVAPVAASGWYLWARAVDQYASYLGFSVRSETGAGTSELLGGLTSLVGMTSNSSTDTDILYKFIQSHDLVERVDERLDLRRIWSKAPGDPIFGYTGNESLEDLLSEWERKVRIYYDDGMIDLRVLAFDPQDARAITQAIFDESTRMINRLNDIAREDALRYARDDLAEALARLKAARQDMMAFRNRHQLVDPSADVQGQVGVVTSLQQQLAEALVQLGLLRANAQPGDPRIEQAELRIGIIRDQIDEERQKFGSETATGEALSEVVGQFESLTVDREFAERSYTAALATYDTARAEASRQSRYLAAYVKPTLAQESKYPERGKLLLIMSGFLLILWIIGVLIFYSLRDRR